MRQETKTEKSRNCLRDLDLPYYMRNSLTGGAEGGTRTPTVLRPSAPQAGASANSATSARKAVLSRQLTVLSFQSHLIWRSSARITVATSRRILTDNRSLTTDDFFLLLCRRRRRRRRKRWERGSHRRRLDRRVLQHGTRRVFRGVNRQAHRSDYKKHGQTPGDLCQQCHGTARPERRLAYAAESRSDINVLATLKQHRADQQDARQDVNNLKNRKHTGKSLSGRLSRGGNSPGLERNRPLDLPHRPGLHQFLPAPSACLHCPASRCRRTKS